MTAKSKKSKTVKKAPEETTPAPKSDDRFSQFTLQNLKLQNGKWVLSLIVAREFKKVYSDYEVRFTVDLDPIDQKIEAKKKEKQDYELQNQMEMFDEVKKRALEEFDTSIGNLMEERAGMLDECKGLSFLAHVIGHSEKGFMKTQLLLLVPSDAVPELDERYKLLEKYKVEFIKDLSNHDTVENG